MSTNGKAPSRSREDVLTAVLAHVPFDGWGEASFCKAAKDLGQPLAFVKMAFPGGAAAMLEAHLKATDEAMVAALKKKNLAKMKIRERIECAVLTRLGLNAKTREAVRRTLGFLALPINAKLSATCLWRTADAMWRAAGDTSTDYNYYTKRLILSAVYSSTLLVWLNDDSTGLKNTKAFLARRIGNVMQFEKAKARAREIVKDLPNPAKILGELRYPEGHR
jgi:ubiquinone biosynthesis protein COQ9